MGKGTLLLSARNSGMHLALVQRDLFNMRQVQGHHFIFVMRLSPPLVLVKLTVEIPIRKGGVEAISNMSAGKQPKITKTSPCSF